MKRLPAAVLAIAAAFSAAAPAHAAWLEAKSTHFTVVGDMSETELRRRTQQLEQYDAMLRYLLGVKETIPVTVYVLGSLGDVQQAMGGNRSVAGFYSASAQRAFAVVPERFTNSVEDFTPRVVLFHEYAHHMLLSNTDVFMPGWAQEGLAEMFATAKIESDGSVVIGDKNDARGFAMFNAHRWSVERMLESDFDPPARDEAIEKYSRGWALVHYLWMSGERPGQYVDFIAELNKTVDPVASGEKAFGDLDKLDRELDRYLRAHKYNLSRFTADQLETPTEMTIRPLSEGEAAILTYRIASSVGVTEETAGPLADKARPIAARYPDDVAVQTAMAEMEYDAKRDDAASAAADRALAGDPDNLYAMVYKGRLVMRRALEAKDSELAREARSWFLKANRIDPDNALPFMLYYDSFGAMGETPPANAVAGLYRATTLVPQDTSLRIRSALALLREGNVERARSIIAPAAFVAEGFGENNPLKLIEAMEESLDSETLLAKAGELKLGQVNDFIAPPADEGEDGQNDAE